MGLFGNANRREGAIVGTGGGGAPVATFAITNVAQTAGKAAGGSTVVVTATGIVGTPTSTLGAVSAVTGTTFTITTAAHAAGGVAWTATNGNAQVSASQTFTYLAPPTLASLTPNNGPATIANAGVVFAGTNFPAAGTGCPIGGSVGAGAISGATLGTSTSLTAGFSAPGTGALSATLTVDGVASNTLASAYTGNPAPIYASSTAVSSSGGSFTVTGQNFVATPTASGSGGIGALTVTFVSATNITITVPPETAGTYGLAVTNPDGQSFTQADGLRISSVLTPQTILGATLILEASGGSYTSPTWTDSSGYGNNFVNGATAPTYSASSATMNNLSSLTFSGGATAACSAFTFAGGSDWFTYVVANVTSAGTMIQAIAKAFGGAILGWNDGASGIPVQRSTTGVLVAQWPTSIVGLGKLAIYGYQHFNGTNQTLGIAVNDQIEQTVTTSGANPSNGTATIGDTGITVEIGEIIMANTQPTPTQLQQLFAYLNFKYQLLPPLTYVRSTKLLATGGIFRISGTGFLPGIAVSSPLTSLTTVYNGPTSITVTAAAGAYAPGTYDLTILNADGSAITEAGALTVTASLDPMTILQNPCVLWLEGGLVTLSGSSVTVWPDGSCFGNDVPGAAGALPTLTASDANFGNQPTVNASGSQYMLNTGFTLAAASGSACQMWIVCRQTGGGTNGVVSYDDAGGLEVYGSSGSTGPRCLGRGNSANWGANLTNIAKVVMLSTTAGSAGASGTNAVDVDNSGSPVTATGNYSNTIPAAASLSIFANNSGVYKISGAIAEIVIANQIQSSTVLAQMQTYFSAKYGV